MTRNRKPFFDTYMSTHKRSDCMLKFQFICTHSPHSWVSHLMSYSPNTRGIVYLYMLIIVTCLILYVCRGNLAFKCHWILSKFMEIATSIYLFLISGMNFSLELSDYWAFSLMHAACKLQSVVVRITVLVSVLNKGEFGLLYIKHSEWYLTWFTEWTGETTKTCTGEFKARHFFTLTSIATGVR